METLLRSLLLAVVFALGFVSASSTVAADPPTAKQDEQLVDINSTTQKELEALPGVGEAYAKKIIAGRPYDRKDQLKSRKIVPDGVYAKFADKIIAKQPPAKKK
jgi:DNA uptake protein ComE-like DNA-binding protein